jgi:hypothetical protein
VLLSPGIPASLAPIRPDSVLPAADMIEPVRQSLGTGARHAYASKLADVWLGLSDTLSRLEALASEPDETLADDEALVALPGLQYTLHAASESVAGIAPPAGAEAQHEELAGALADARDATGEVADCLAVGGVDAAWPLVYEWRGALFRVRLARQRLASRPAEGTGERPEPRPRFTPSVLVCAGGLLATIFGALLGFWPVAAAGLVLAAVAILRHRP